MYVCEFSTIYTCTYTHTLIWKPAYDSTRDKIHYKVNLDNSFNYVLGDVNVFSQPHSHLNPYQKTSAYLVIHD